MGDELGRPDHTSRTTEFNADSKGGRSYYCHAGKSGWKCQLVRFIDTIQMCFLDSFLVNPKYK